MAARKIVRGSLSMLRPARSIILLYHRIGGLRPDPFLLNVSPEHFAEHLEVVRRCGGPVPVSRLAAGVRDGESRSRGIAVTFDDGYADNLWRASPLLERYEIPATVFVTSGHVGSCEEFWWDEIAHLVLGPHALPSRLCLTLRGSEHEWELRTAESCQEPEAACDWNILAAKDTTPRQALLRSLRELLRPLSAAQRNHALLQLRAWSQRSPTAIAAHSPLSLEELARLGKSPLIDIGAHTVTHPVLAALEHNEQRWEIMRSKADLEAAVGRPIVGFAYPFGSHDDYTNETVGLVKEAGFEWACSNSGGHIRDTTNLYELPRYTVLDWDGDEFATRLRDLLPS